MLTYKQYKSLNESFDCTLGLSQRQAVGVTSNAGPTLDEFMQLLDEKKKMKKKMLGDMGDDETGDGEMVEPSSLKDKKVVVDKDDMGDHDHDHDDDDDDMGDDDMGDDDGGDIDLKGLKGDKLMMMKKKMKNKMKKCSKKMKKEAAEETAPEVADDPWMQSVMGMLKGDNERHWDGFSPLTNEDALIPASDPNKGLVDEQPQPGDVGFAPQGRIGSF